MRLLSILSASAFALSTSVALAQVGPTPGGTTPGSLGAPGATQAPQHIPAVNPFTQGDVSKVTGTPVYGSDGQRIGTVSHVLMNGDAKRIDRLVVAQGGVLGMGAHHVALPVDQFRWDQQKEGFTIAKTASDVKSMAEWQAPNTTAGSGSSMPPATHGADTNGPAH